MASNADQPGPFREINGVPLLGPAPEPPPRLGVRLDLEFLPDGVPPDVRLKLALKTLWRRFKAKNLGCVDLPESGSPTRASRK
jgi:hypothetical protein